MRVSVQKETVSGWSTTTSLTYAADTHNDTVEITEDGVDFGGYDLGPRAADDAAAAWNGSSRRTATSRRSSSGAIHLNNSSGVCARMNLRYLTESGRVPDVAGRRHGVLARQRPPLLERQPDAVRLD